MSDVLPALIGIGGVAVGGSIQWVAATKAQRSQYLLGIAQKREAYYGRVLLAVDRLALAHGRDADQSQQAMVSQLQDATPGEQVKVSYTRTPEVVADIRDATKEWRDVLGERYVNAGDPVAATMSMLDRSRDALVRHFNSGNLPAGIEWYGGDFDRSIRRVKAAVGFATAHGAALVLRETSHWWNRKLRKSGKKAVADAQRRLQEIDSETVAES